MFRLRKYIKPFLLSLLAAIFLLFIQANTDLALPDYMADIVNIGVQQGGVDKALPEAMRAQTFDHLALFLSAEQQAQVLDAYTLVEPDTPQAADLLGTYPALADEPVYLLKPVDAATQDALEGILAKPLLLVFGLEQVSENPEQAAMLFPNSNFDLSKLPPGMNIFDALQMMPAAQKDQIMSALDERFQALGGEKALRQAGARAVLGEYEALQMNTAKIQQNYILRVGGLMLLVALVSAVATITVGLLGARIAAGLARDLRRVLFERVMRFSSAELDRFSTASLITRATNDITQIQSVTIIMVRMVFYAPLLAIGGIVLALQKSPSMWWTIALAVLILLTLIATVFTIAVPKFKIIQQLIDRLNLVARENLSGIMVVRAFGREHHEEERFDHTNLDLTETSLFVNRVFVVVMPVMMLVMDGVMILILWVGTREVAQAQIQVGDMMAFMQYAMRIVFAFMMLSMLFIMFPRADVSANRIADVLETPITIKDAENPRHFPTPFRPSLEFRHVSFRYPDADEDVLHDISFKIEAGQTVGIMGTTGSGKSTVVNLIPRFFDVTEGQISIDGANIRDVPLSELRARIGYVPQRSNLFTGTIETNLRFGDEEADEQALTLALNIAQAADFVLSGPDGLRAEVSQGGINFSGGQKQRLNIARALVKRAPIYIFDDSFSALDFKTDARLRRALLDNLGDSTALIVSQRVATIKNADKILVLDEGCLIADGTHDELMQTCDVYREIAFSQLKQEALS